MELPGRRYSHRERWCQSGEGVGREICNLSLFPSSDLLVFSVGRTETEPEEKGLLGTAHSP